MSKVGVVEPADADKPADVDKLVTEAARIVARSVSRDGRAAEMRRVYGAGAFAASFRSVAALREFTRAPTYAPVVFCDAEAAVRLGDVALGALARARSVIVVVIDCVEADTRAVLRGLDDARPRLEHALGLTWHELKAEREPEPLSDARHATLDALARRQHPEVPRRLLLTGVDRELDAGKFECIEEADFTTLLTRTRALVERGDVADTLERLWRELEPTRHVLVWLREVAGQPDTDSVWLSARRSPEPAAAAQAPCPPPPPPSTAGGET